MFGGEGGLATVTSILLGIWWTLLAIKHDSVITKCKVDLELEENLAKIATINHLNTHTLVI